MYGILAACIAVMAMFLGLFALSVEPAPNDLQARLSVETAAPIVAKKSAAELN